MEQFTEEQKQQLINLKNHLPYRIVFGVIFPDGEFCTFAEYTKHKLNKYARLGYPVILAQ
jgi:hypothetical protein